MNKSHGPRATAPSPALSPLLGTLPPTGVAYVFGQFDQFDQFIDRHRGSRLTACTAGPGLYLARRRPAWDGLSAASTAAIITAAGVPTLKAAFYRQTLRGAREIGLTCSTGSRTTRMICCPASRSSHVLLLACGVKRGVPSTG